MAEYEYEDQDGGAGYSTGTRSSAGRRSSGGQRRRGTREGQRGDDASRRFRKRRKKCVFCEEKVKAIDYKRADVLRGFLTGRGKIRPQRQTGTCASHQRQLSIAIKRARHLALLPFVVESKR